MKKAVTSERDLPWAMKRIFEKALDALWPDVRVELKEGLSGMVLKSHNTENDDGSSSSGDLVGASRMPPCWHPARWRAWLLHHYLPCDKGSWTSLRRDPGFVFLTLLTLVPVYGVRFAFHAVLLALIYLPGGRDLDE